MICYQWLITLNERLNTCPMSLSDNDYIKGVQGVVTQFEKTLADSAWSVLKHLANPSTLNCTKLSAWMKVRANRKSSVKHYKQVIKLVTRLSGTQWCG